MRLFRSLLKVLNHSAQRPRRRTSPLPPVEAMEVRVLMSATSSLIAHDQANLTSQVVQAPGRSAQDVVIDAHQISGRPGHSYEVGVIIVDDASGKIGNLSPGASGYANAALSSPSRHVLFSATDGQHAQGQVTIPGGSFFMLYFIEDGTATDVLSKNPTNQPGQSPVALFSPVSANPSGDNQMTHRAGFLYGWGNSSATSHRPDLVFRLHIGRPKAPPDTKPPHAALSITGTVPTTTDGFDVQFTEAMKRTDLQKKYYTLTKTSGTGSGSTIEIQAVRFVDSMTVHLKLKKPLTAGTYRFDIGNGLTDQAGRALVNPKSFTFTVA